MRIRQGALAERQTRRQPADRLTNLRPAEHRISLRPVEHRISQQRAEHRISRQRVGHQINRQPAVPPVEQAIRMIPMEARKKSLRPAAPPVGPVTNRKFSFLQIFISMSNGSGGCERNRRFHINFDLTGQRILSLIKYPDVMTSPPAL